MNDKIILIINNGIAGGGIERASVSLANHFVGLGFKLHIVALYKRDHFFTLDTRINFIEPNFCRKTINRYLYVLKMMWYLRANIKRIKPDVILAFGEWTNPFVVVASMGFNVPIFLSDRMSPLAKLSYINALLKIFLYKKTNGLVAQTGYAKKILFKNTGSTNIKVIPNPVNNIKKVDCEVLNRIVTVGRLSKEKGHRYLLEAFAKVNDKSWKLSLVGDGTERHSLELLAIRLGIFDRVLFHGLLKDLSLQLSESKIFVLPSLSEGFPNALIEAMSVPLACISSNCIAGPSEIIDDGVNGILVKPGDAGELASALNRLIENPDLREKLSSEAFKIRETFAFDKIAQSCIDFIFQKNN